MANNSTVKYPKWKWKIATNIKNCPNQAKVFSLSFVDIPTVYTRNYSM